jgi:hypothetical protein
VPSSIFNSVQWSEQQMSTVTEFLASGGRIFRKRQGRRTITVAYKRSVEENDTVIYGATIHKQDSPSDTFRRKPHNSTAVSRCETNPVTVSNAIFSPDSEASQADVEKFIRNCLVSQGCRSESVAAEEVVVENG